MQSHFTNSWTAQPNAITTALIKNSLPYVDQLSKLPIYLADNIIHRFNDDDYNKILEVVKSRVNKIKLYVNITCSTVLFDPTAAKFAEHKRKLVRLETDPIWLTVSMFYHYDYTKY